MNRTTARVALVAFVALSWAWPALADVPPPPSSQPGGLLLMLAAGAIVLLVLWLLIRGALGLSQKEDPEDEAGVGVLEGIDEDDDEPKKKR